MMIYKQFIALTNQITTNAELQLQQQECCNRTSIMKQEVTLPLTYQYSMQNVLHACSYRTIACIESSYTNLGECKIIPVISRVVFMQAD